MREFYEGELIKALSRQNILYQENFELAKQVLQNEFETRLKAKDDSIQIQHREDLVHIYKRGTESVDSIKSVLAGNYCQATLFSKSYCYGCISHTRCPLDAVRASAG